MDADIIAWVAAVEKRFDVTPDQKVLLTECARIRQRIADCERAIAEDGIMVDVRGGGKKLHPLARHMENAEGLLLRYIKELGLAEQEEKN